jgi:hypothetical protein
MFSSLNLLSVLPSEIQNGVHRLDSANHGYSANRGWCPPIPKPVAEEKSGMVAARLQLLGSNDALP